MRGAMTMAAMRRKQERDEAAVATAPIWLVPLRDAVLQKCLDEAASCGEPVWQSAPIVFAAVDDEEDDDCCDRLWMAWLARTRPVTPLSRARIDAVVEAIRVAGFAVLLYPGTRPAHTHRLSVAGWMGSSK